MNVEYLFKVAPGITHEIIHRYDPGLFHAVPLLLLKNFDLFNMDAVQSLDMNDLYDAKPVKKKIFREMVTCYGPNLMYYEPRLRIVREYTSPKMKVETFWSPVTYGCIGIRMRKHPNPMGGYELIALSIEEDPSKSQIEKKLEMMNIYTSRVDRLPGDHVLFDVVVDKQYQRLDGIGNFGIINSRNDIFTDKNFI